MNSGETTIFTAIAITAVTLGIIIFYFFISIIRQQRRNLQLQKQNMLTEINAMESERARIAADLHDDVSSILSVVRFQINSLQVANTDEALQVQAASEHLDGLMNRLREISNNLMPASLLRKGLVVSVNEFLRQVEASAKLKVAFTYSDVIAVSQEKSINIYRIIQEVVHNTLRHAVATELTMQLEARNNTLFIFYKDNGIGFNFDEAVKSSSGFGLRSLRSRVDLIGGTLQSDSAAQKGTRFIFQIPIN